MQPYSLNTEGDLSRTRGPTDEASQDISSGGCRCLRCLLAAREIGMVRRARDSRSELGRGGGIQDV